VGNAYEVHLRMPYRAAGAKAAAPRGAADPAAAKPAAGNGRSPAAGGADDAPVGFIADGKVSHG